MKRNFVLLFSVLAAGACSYSNAQTISTVAGNGTPGYLADGVAATATELNGPAGVFVDAAGNLYIADAYNHRVRKVSTTGIITTIAGTGTAGYSGDGAAATAAQLKTPLSVAINSTGDIFICDSDNSRIRKINAAGVISTVAGNGSLGFSGDTGPATDAVLFKPLGLYIDNTDNLYFADGFNHRIRKIDGTTGIITSVAGNGVAGFTGDGGNPIAASLNNPAGITKDAAGNIYIADKTNNRIRKIDGAGITSTIAGGLLQVQREMVGLPPPPC